MFNLVREIQQPEIVQHETIMQTREFWDWFGYDGTIDEMDKIEAPPTASEGAVPIAMVETKQPVPVGGRPRQYGQEARA